VSQAAVTGEPRVLRRLIVTAIVAAAVGALVGIAAGYQLSDHGAAPVFKAAQSEKSRHRAPYGVVTTVGPDSVTITSFGRDVTVKTSADTIVSATEDATLADIDEGETIIVSGDAANDGTVRADEIVVLPTRWLFLLG
jgi:hypothetical protein